MSASHITLLRRAGDFYGALFDDLAAARHSIQIQMYSIEWGDVSERLKTILIERAGGGVRIDLVYDSFGSLGVPAFVFEELEAAGINVIEYHPVNPRRVKGPFTFRALFRRNHRKIILIDSKIYYLGGMNIGERFLGWEDIMIRGEGGPISELKESFRDVLGEKPRLLGSIRGRRVRPAGLIEVLNSRPMTSNYPIKRLYLSAIKRAKKRIWIAQAYFLPRRRLLKALTRAAMKEVDVRVIIPDVSDVRIVDLATWSALGRPLKHGVKVFRFLDRMLHSKMAIIDDNWMTIGAANLDSMSFYWNLEANLVIRDPEVIGRAAEIFAEYEANSRAIGAAEPERRPLPLRLIGKALYYYSWIL